MAGLSSDIHITRAEMIRTWDMTDQDGSVTGLLNECTITIHTSTEELGRLQPWTDKRQYKYKQGAMWLASDGRGMDTKSTPRDNPASILLNLVSKSSF